MKIEERPQEFCDPRLKIFENVLKRKCSEIILKSGGLQNDQVSRFIPSGLLSNLLAQSTALEKDNHASGMIRELLTSHTQVLILSGLSLPSKHLDTRELVCVLSENSRFNTLIVDDLHISVKDAELLKVFGNLMERVTCLRYGSVVSDVINHPSDELFAQLARDHLSKNHKLCFVDLRGSEVDLIATNSKRNLPINFAGEMRRWARRLKGLAFETDVSLYRALRILNRQCPLLKSICVNTTRSVSDAFDNLRDVVDHVVENQQIEQLPKLKRLCLCGHFRVTDRVLQCILPSVPALSFLNISGCAVNFEQYFMHLPSTLDELIIDDCNRSQLLKEHRSIVRQLLQKCPNLIIYVSKPHFEGDEFESLKGLALLNGAKSILFQKFDNSFEDDDGLIAFELRVKELNHKVPWSIMYGIPDFEAKFEAVPESELTPNLNLSTELGRIPWPQERQEFMPKPMSKNKFAYKGDFLSDRLVEQQERAQAFQNTLMNKFKHVTLFYNEKKNELEDRFDDKDLIPTIGLGTLAGLISWKSNQSAPFPLKAIFCLGGIFTSSLLTHEKFRLRLKEEISSNISEEIKVKIRDVDERIGIFGANIWSQGESLFNQLKNKVLNKP